jgi:glyoxylase-like metal-dependent hydrolase (beta-lactamase superfamily II)
MARAYVELAPGLVRIPTAPRDAINSFAFLEDDGSVTLVDAGLKRAPRRIEAALAELGRQPTDVRRILLTHAHLDHASGARTLKDHTHGRLATHEVESGFVRDGRPPPNDRRSFVARVLSLLPGKFAGVDVDETFADGDLLDAGGGVRVVHTPGHTPGHVSFLHERSGTLITGDSLFNWTGITFSPKYWCSDIPLSRETASRLGELDYEVAAFTHGSEIREDAREKIRAFLRRKGMVRS